MALFEFELRELAKVTPWGEAPDLRLHWFALTDGCYHMNVKGKELFRFTDEIIKHWELQGSTPSWTPYADYQVARFYEDLLSILPDILQPIPRELHKYVQTLEGQHDYNAKLDVRAKDDEDWWSDDYENAIRWFWCRSLPGGHMLTPTVYFFRFDDSIKVRGADLDKKIDDIALWTESDVEASFTVDQFLDEVQTFHNDLMAQMKTRVQTVATNAPFPHVNINMEQLLTEQEQRCSSLQKALNKSPTVLDWSLVTSAIDTLGVI